MRYILARGLTEPVEKPDVMLVGNGRRLVYRRGNGTPARVVNQKEIKFTEVGLWLRSVIQTKTSTEFVKACDLTCNGLDKTNFPHLKND